MEFTTVLSKLNYFAVFAAALATFVIGGLWYSPLLFAKKWMSANNFTEGDLKAGRLEVIFASSFVLALISALVLAMFIGPTATVALGITAGILVGLGWVTTSFGITYLFERKPLVLFLINAG